MAKVIFNNDYILCALLITAGVFHFYAFRYLSYVKMKQMQMSDLIGAYKTALSVFHEGMSLAQVDELAFQKWSLLTHVAKKTKSPFMIIIPCRNRKLDLLTFLLYMPTYFHLQGAQMDILVIEQAAGGFFNKGKLLNVAVREVDKINAAQNVRDRLFGYKCFSFHDVDKLPIHPDSPYVCRMGPHNLIRQRAFINGRKSTYRSYLGGVTMFTREQLELMNGASNSYIGWGGEDDDMWNRVLMAKLQVFRPSYEKGRFFEFNFHHKRIKNPLRFKNVYEKNRTDIMLKDGLRQVEYKVLERLDYKTFVWLRVEI